MVQTDEIRIQTALNWIEQCRGLNLGIPTDLTAADAVITAIHETRYFEDSGGKYPYDEIVWKVVFRKEWAVDLDENGAPRGTPWRMSERGRVI